ncbi:MAG: hypothetical protein NC409_04960 [Clostridium sp.]|nr:hypothetical protein [Clostridium sp.]
MKKKWFAALLAVLLCVNSLSVSAAPQYMADGAVFDAQWYLAQNPDVAAVFSGNASPEVLYGHYTTYGIYEGRLPYNPLTFDPANVLPYQSGTGTVPGTTAQTDITPAVSNNRNAQNYRWYSNYNWNWSDTVKSYLYENPMGGLTRVEYIDGQEMVKVMGGSDQGLTRVEYIDGQIVVEDYDDAFHITSSRSIPMELPLWGGFFAGQNYNFLIFGQDNPAQDNNREVVRVVKYSKDWQRLGHTSLCGANTVSPFDAGSLRCAEYGNYLYIRTCHTMYASARDGLNHQANMTMAVRQSDMTLTDTYHIVMNSSVGYVSHSFNQFVLVDQDQNLVTLDHGDAYPRSIVLMRYNSAKAGGEKFSGSVSQSTLMAFPGTTGDNYTGASVGGLAETASGYVTAFNYDGIGGRGTREIYIGYTAKNGLASSAARITQSDGMLTPVLVSTGLSGGYLMWTDARGTFYYTRYTDGGGIGAIGTADAALSDCQPICHNGEVIWYVTSNSAPVFYKLDAAGGITAVAAQ